MWSHHRTTIGLFSDKAYIAWFSASHNPPTSLPLLSANGVYFLGHWWIYVDSSIIDGAWGLRSQQFLHYLFRGLWNLTILRLSCAGEPDVITKYRKNGIWYQSKNISSIDCTSWLTLESIPVVGKISKSWKYFRVKEQPWPHHALFGINLLPFGLIKDGSSIFRNIFDSCICLFTSSWGQGSVGWVITSSNDDSRSGESGIAYHWYQYLVACAICRN